MLRKFLGPVVLALALPIAAAAQSQATTGVIRGVVSDPSGAPVVGAAVTLRETHTGFQRQVTTNDRGVFVASLLPLGTYDVAGRAVGFGEAKRTGIPLRVGETVDLALRVAAVELQAVTVEASQPVVDATKVETSTRLPTEAVAGLPNNGRNYLNLTLLTPNVGLVQGPDGDELSIGGQKGIHNNVSVDGADFNNPFFGEQRGGQRPPFTFNLDAVQEVVVVAGGANAEFGRSSGGFVNVITKSGTNELRGTAHVYAKSDAISGAPSHAGRTFEPDFRQDQFGFTLGGPLKRDRAFFFIAYDQQIYDDVKQKTRDTTGSFNLLKAWMDTAYAGALQGDFGPIARTNDARALLAKFDFRLSERHNLSLKYNYTWSQQQNGTFDVDSWARSANAVEQDHSNAVNGSLRSYLSSNASNEFRFQYSREDRPRPYEGPRSSLLGPNPADPPASRPFPDVAMDFGGQYRFGMPFFIPVQYYDTRLQLLDNLSWAKGNHFFKVGGEFNRVNSVQTFIGFANSRYIFASVQGFLDYLIDSTNAGGLLLYLQQAGVGRTVREAGTQEIPQTELAFYIQDSWRPNPKLTLDYGLRWEAQLQPDPITPPSQVFFGPFIGRTVTNATGTYTFPSDGTIPSDKKMIQPRFGFAYDPNADGRQVIRGSAGLYYARIPGLNLASSRSTNGSIGLTYVTGGAGAPAFGSLFPSNVAPAAVNHPDIFVFDKNFQNPRTLTASLAYERQLGSDLGALISVTHARTDHLTRFVNRNDAVFGSPWDTSLTTPLDPNGVGQLTTVESSAKSRYTGITVGLKRVLDPNFQFQINYTLSFDKSDDDNERDPFTLRYVRADSLQAEYNWSDRDQRHRVNAWALVRLPGGIYMNNRVSYYSAQPVSENCGAGNVGDGARAASAADRICRDTLAAGAGRILRRNTLRKDNAYFSWDLRVSRPFDLGRQGQVEAIVEVFNLTGNDNFRDPSYGNLVFNFDGTIRSGLGDPRQLQAGLRWLF
jgi:outer membrane receptor for ferrienterochelin and colicin